MCELYALLYPSNLTLDPGVYRVLNRINLGPREVFCFSPTSFFSFLLFFFS